MIIGDDADRLDAHGTIRAAGCVVWRAAETGLEVLVAHRDRYDDWSFPKGKRDPGESDEACARREVKEETNLEGEFGPELTSVTYVDHKGRNKVVRYWLMRWCRGEFVPNEEVDEVLWLGPPEAAALLSYQHDENLLIEAVGVLRSMP